MDYQISEHDRSKAKLPHELFLINLIFNHVFLFIAAVSAPSFQATVAAVPIISLAIMVFTVARARQAVSRDPSYVCAHWQIAARRTVLFAGLWLAIIALAGALFELSGGDPKPLHWAIGGAAALPTMGIMLVLIIMESEALQQASTGRLPAWATCTNPQ